MGHCVHPQLVLAACESLCPVHTGICQSCLICSTFRLCLPACELSEGWGPGWSSNLKARNSMLYVLNTQKYMAEQ